MEDDGVHILVKRGDKSYYVKQSKVALSRYLKAKGADRQLRSQLYRQRGTSTAGKIWQRAVRVVQAMEGLSTSGEITYSVDKALAGYWPRDSRGRRLLRRTAAWKLIPGQLSPNFNIREFACHNGVGYVEGLVKEKGLSKANAKTRAKELANYLERVRVKHGKTLRVTSAYRTVAYNRAIGGASNSAHTRGFASDTPPPDGITLEEHRQVVREVFPGGVGYYPQANFIHGDFDPELGRREWNGP